MRIAIIDLGTNTCNLSIAELSGGDFKILHQSKQLVKLGDGKIRENEISAEASLRTVDAFCVHKKIIDEYKVDTVRVIATSAVRTAENKVQFLEELGEASGWLVKLVSGEREAELIFKGVLLAFKNIDDPVVILDIGGGSNELILAYKNEQFWKESRPSGMARIINAFKISDPILPDEIGVLQQYFKEEHKRAIVNCKGKRVKTLVGCSGAFDTIADIIDEVNPGEKQRITQQICLSDFYKVYEVLLKSTSEQRLNMKGMDNVRVDLIVPAVILIETLISAMDIERIVQTDFALREGLLYEFLEQEAN